MDCTFKTPEGKFNLRVGAVITDGKRVLVSKDGSHSFYWVTGGRVKLGETTEEAILREIREELGVEAEIARLYSIAEKFFTVDGVFYHELEYLYLIKPFDIAKIGRPLLPPLERYPYGRVRARLHPQRSGYLPGRHAEEQKRMIIRSYYGIYPKKAKQV